MDIYLDRRAVKQIRVSAEEAIEEGDTDTLREDVMEAFSDDQIEEIERRIDTGDFYDFLTDMLDEWSGDDTDELFELLESQLGDAGVDLKFSRDGLVDSEDDDDDAESDDDEDDDDDDDDAESAVDLDDDSIAPTTPRDEEVL